MVKGLSVFQDWFKDFEDQYLAGRRLLPVRARWPSQQARSSFMGRRGQADSLEGHRMDGDVRARARG